MEGGGHSSEGGAFSTKDGHGTGRCSSLEGLALPVGNVVGAGVS